MPRIEKVDSPHDNRIRFFNEEDSEKAKQLSSEIMNLLKAKNIEKKIEPKNFTGRFKAPQGQLEVWLNIDKPEG